ncbi:testis-specific Y-encoded protein 2-like [Tursiops truncatus]|uniref:Testis-specific Y-encoded protein 2-like n=1 Tax=Tursiops truncatus TaxID=9739 RepID=A0A6J3QWG2_TURTR|nr:testis-specific Y-encoded protein 2-like [Tursiops truncatus]
MAGLGKWRTWGGQDDERFSPQRSAIVVGCPAWCSAHVLSFQLPHIRCYPSSEPGPHGNEAGPGVVLGVGGGPQEAGARGSPGVVREVGRVLALADGWGEEAAIFSGEVVRQCAALLEGEVARIMEVFWQPVEDMMEEVEVVAEKQQQQVVAEEQEEKPQEQGQEEPGPSPKSASLEALEALKVLQLQLEPVNRECSRQHFRLKVTTLRRRKPYLEHRSTIIQSIPGFWVKVFVNHPRMSAMISTQDKDMLSYMTNLKVEEFADRSDYRKIMLFFRKNPYFQNEVVVKEYLTEATRYRASHLAPIQWHRRFEEEMYSRRHNNSGLNFFNWFSDHSCVGSSRIARVGCLWASSAMAMLFGWSGEGVWAWPGLACPDRAPFPYQIIGEDLWPNPLRYYPREKGPSGTGHREEDRHSRS